MITLCARLYHNLVNAIVMLNHNLVIYSFVDFIILSFGYFNFEEKHYDFGR